MKGIKEMATLTFLDPSGSNLRSDVLSASSRKKLTPTSNNAPWIYCNYPERIGDGNKSWGTAENGYYINRQTVNGPAQIFYSAPAKLHVSEGTGGKPEYDSAVYHFRYQEDGTGRLYQEEAG